MSLVIVFARKQLTVYDWNLITYDYLVRDTLCTRSAPNIYIYTYLETHVRLDTKNVHIGIANTCKEITSMLIRLYRLQEGGGFSCVKDWRRPYTDWRSTVNANYHWRRLRLPRRWMTRRFIGFMCKRNDCSGLCTQIMMGLICNKCVCPLIDLICMDRCVNLLEKLYGHNKIDAVIASRSWYI